MLKSVRLFCVAIAFWAGAATAAPTPAMLWKARALEASKRSEAMRPGKPGSADRYRAMIEAAFMLHIANEDTVRKQSKTGDGFHLLLRGADGTGYLDVVYLYSDGGELVAARVDMIPKGWRLVFPVAGELKKFQGDMIGVTTPDGVSIFFDRHDPFEPIVVGD